MRSHKVIITVSARIGRFGTCTSTNPTKNGKKSGEKLVGGSVELVPKLHLSKEIATSVIGKTLFYFDGFIVSDFVRLLSTKSSDIEEGFHQKSVFRIEPPLPLETDVVSGRGTQGGYHGFHRETHASYWRH